MYAQGAVLLALAESDGVTGSTNALAPLNAVITAVVQSQKASKANPKDVGGWRRTPDAHDSDVSVTGWLVMGLKSARMAGVTVPDEAFNMASKYLWNAYNGGHFKYCIHSTGHGASTAIGILCQQVMGHGDDPRIKTALATLKGAKEFQVHSQLDSAYGSYYTTQAMFQAGGQYWKHWNKQISVTLVNAQKYDGHWEAASEKQWGPVTDETLCCLMLEADYRYVPYRGNPSPSATTVNPSATEVTK